MRGWKAEIRAAAAQVIDRLEGDLLFTDPAQLFEDARRAKELKQRDLIRALTGRTSAGEPVEATGFDGGSRRTVPVPESHEQTLTRVLGSGEADVGHRM